MFAYNEFCLFRILCFLAGATRLCQFTKEPGWASNEEANGFLGEAAALIKGRPAQP
jgi:hypothetical protein